MVLELRDKVRDLAGPDQPRPARAAEEDLVAALVNLGYKASAAEKAVSSVEQEADDFEAKAFAEKLRLALRKLSRV